MPKSLKGFGKCVRFILSSVRKEHQYQMRGSYQEAASHSGEESFQIEKSKIMLTSLSYPSPLSTMRLTGMDHLSKISQDQ